jgi:hypothetical protein
VTPSDAHPGRPRFRGPAGPVPPDLAASLLSRLGFLAVADLPDRPGPGLLLVAIRDRPTLRHYDPERVTFWVADGERGIRRTIDRSTATPVATEFAWGLIRIEDRLHVTNEYLAFGGRVEADRVDDAVLVRFVSPAPILRRGGHSQGIDEGAETLGGWFGRLRSAIDEAPAVEARITLAEPLEVYAAFLADTIEQLNANATIRSVYADLACLLRAEGVRLREERPDVWRRGAELRAAVSRALDRAPRPGAPAAAR